MRPFSTPALLDLLRRSIRLVAALAAAYVIAAFVTNAAVPIAFRAEAALVLVLSAFRPAWGLLLVAAVAPLGDVFAPVLGSRPMMHAETLVLAFLCAWLATGVAGRNASSHSNRVASAMWVFSCVLIGSVAATALELYRASPPQLHLTAAALAQSYLLMIVDPIGAHNAASLLEGLALIAAVVELTRRSPRLESWLPRVLVGSAVVTAIASGFLAIGIAPAATMVRYMAVRLPRYSAAMSDVNAAGSSYLLLLGVSVGIAVSQRRTRWVWAAASAIILAGLALTGSRAAFAAGAVVACAAGALWVLGAQAQKTRLVAGVIIAAGIIVAIGVALTPSARTSLDMRAGFTQTSVRMIEARPVFGVGTGRYYPLSRLVLPPRLAWFYGQENAHDYYLQTAAEIGLVGAAAAAWILAGILFGPLAEIWRRRFRWVSAGCAEGAVAYLVTAVAGHPFLVAEAAIPFWIVLGLLGAERADAAPGPGPRSFPHLAALAFGCGLLLTVPFRPGMPHIRVRTPDDGFTEWKTDENGRQFREAKDFASLFVAPNVTLVEIPLRSAAESAEPVKLGVVVPGWSRRQVVVGREWTNLLISFAPQDPLLPGQRINLALLPIAKTPKPDRPAVYVGQLRIVEARQ